MTTKSALITRISDDMARTDINSQIGEAIDDAIRFYRDTRFYFNETRDSTFATVAAQSRYTVSDDADIPLFLSIDNVFIEESSGQKHVLGQCDPAEMEWKLDTSAASGRPYEYAYFDRSFWLYPVPDAVYTIRPLGQIIKAAPAANDEADNVWMTEAFELIRCRAKKYLYGHIIMDLEMAALMDAGERDALRQLRGETSSRVGTGRIVPTSF